MDWINIIQVLGFPIALIIGYFIPKITKADKSKEKWIERLIDQFQADAKEERKLHKEESERRHTAITNGFDSLQGTMVKGFEGIQSTFKDHEDKDHEGMAAITQAIKDHDSNSMKQFDNHRRSFTKLAQSVGNTVLDGEQTVTIFRSDFWYTSDAKLEYIRILLKRNGINIRKNTIKREIKDYLTDKTEESFKRLSAFITPLGDLPTRIKEIFTPEEFQKFLDKVFEEFFKEYDKDKLTKEAIIELKINAIQSHMRHLHRTIATILIAEIEKLEVN